MSDELQKADEKILDLKAKVEAKGAKRVERHRNLEDEVKRLALVVTGLHQVIRDCELNFLALLEALRIKDVVKDEDVEAAKKVLEAEYGRRMMNAFYRREGLLVVDRKSVAGDAVQIVVTEANTEWVPTGENRQMIVYPIGDPKWGLLNDLLVDVAAGGTNKMTLTDDQALAFLGAAPTGQPTRHFLMAVEAILSKVVAKEKQVTN